MGIEAKECVVRLSDRILQTPVLDQGWHWIQLDTADADLSGFFAASGFFALLFAFVGAGAAAARAPFDAS